MSGVMGGSLWIGGVAAILWMFYVLTSRPTVEVGTDGVVLRHLLRARFVAFRDLESIRAAAGADGADGVVQMRFSGGRVERVPLPQASREQTAALDDRLSRAHAAALGGDSGGGRAALLERRGRSVKAWRQDLTELLARGHGYRDAAFTREEAEAVLAAGDASPEQRLGAAIALAAKDGDRARERVRIAAEGCANPRLRVALSDIADGELDDAAALEAIGDEARAAAARSG
jgi:hypothetical protein